VSICGLLQGIVAVDRTFVDSHSSTTCFQTARLPFIDVSALHLPRMVFCGGGNIHCGPYKRHSFYRATRIHSAVCVDYAVARCLFVCLSICPSVCLSHVGNLSKRLNISSHFSPPLHHSNFATFRPLDASSLSVVSFNSTIPRAHSSVITLLSPYGLQSVAEYGTVY